MTQIPTVQQHAVDRGESGGVGQALRGAAAGLARAFAQMLSPADAGVGTTADTRRDAAAAVVDRSAAEHGEGDPRRALSDPLGFEAHAELHGESRRAIAAGELEPGLYERTIGAALRGEGGTGGAAVGKAGGEAAGSGANSGRAAGENGDGRRGGGGHRHAFEGGVSSRGAELGGARLESDAALQAVRTTPVDRGGVGRDRPVDGAGFVGSSRGESVAGGPGATGGEPRVSTPGQAGIRVVAAGAAPAASPGSVAQTEGMVARREGSAFRLETRPATAGRGEAPGEREVVIERVQRGLARLVQREGGTMTLRLEPEALGKVTIEASVADGVVRASFSASTEPARELLLRGLERLRAAMERRGLRVERLEVGGSADRAGAVTGPDSRGLPTPGMAQGSGERLRPASGVERPGVGGEAFAGSEEEPLSGEESPPERDGAHRAWETREGLTARGGAPGAGPGGGGSACEDAAAVGGESVGDRDDDGRSPVFVAAGVLRLDATA